jgi:hypothetical protein
MRSRAVRESRTPLSTTAFCQERARGVCYDPSYSSSLTERLADSSEGNMLGVWYKSVDYGARAAPLCPPPLSAGSAREAFVRTGLRDEG